MPREARYAISGTLFYLTLVFSLIATQKGQDFLATLFKSTEVDSSSGFQILQVGIGIITVGTVIFTSNAIGLAISSVFMFWWDVLRGGYSKDWAKTFENRNEKRGINNENDIENNLITLIIQYSKTISTPLSEGEIKHLLKPFSEDVLLSYIWQHVGEIKEGKYIGEWDTRRYNLYFTYMASLTGILLADILSATVIQWNNMGFTVATSAIYIMSIVFILLFFINGRTLHRDAQQMVKLWVTGATNPALGEILNNFGNKRE